MNWAQQNPIGNVCRTTSSLALSARLNYPIWLSHGHDSAIVILCGNFMSKTRHKTYKGERNERHSIQQPPGKRRQSKHLTHRITYLLTHQWIPSSPYSPSAPSPRRHPSPPPPSMLMAEAEALTASSLKRPSLFDWCLMVLITGKCFCTLSSAALLIDARISYSITLHS